MNLVIDDAVEVKQATKTTEESRRQLGRHSCLGFRLKRMLMVCRSNTVEGRQCFVDPKLEWIDGFKRR